MAGIIGGFSVPGENDNGRRVIDFCAKRGLCAGNTYFKHNSLHKYTRVARGQDGVDVTCAACERNGIKPLRSPCCKNQS